MTRERHVLFGSFERLLSTPVHAANDWWLMVAAGVVLDGSPTWVDLGDSIAAAAEVMVHAMIPDSDANWFRRNAAIALGLSDESAATVWSAASGSEVPLNRFATASSAHSPAVFSLPKADYSSFSTCSRIRPNAIHNGV